MSEEQNNTNPAEALVTKPIKAPVAAIALLLMTSLALNGVLSGVYELRDRYVDIITQQEMLLANVIASQKRNEKANDNNSQVSTGTPKESNRIIVKYKDDAKLPPGLIMAAARANLEKAQGLVKVLTIKGINAEVYQVSDNDSAQEVVDRMLAAKKDLIEYAEVDMLVPPTLIPNDPLFPSQWHHNNVKTTLAWDRALGEGVTFTVLDTGVYQHEDLVWSSVPARNFFDGSNNVTDVFNHGTFVAGTAAAVGNNAVGVSGIAPKTKVLPIRVSGDDGYGSWSAIAQGITYGADNGSRVANASYSACGSATVQNAGAYMRSKGGVVTISAGNYNSDAGYLPSGSLTCVSATDPSDNRASWSSFGAYVDITAPGAGIYTTSNNGGYAGVSGTSFSAPLTAGIYALMFSANPNLTPNQADNILFSTADDLGEPGWDMYYGYGRVNAEKAVAAALATIGTQDTTPPTVPGNLRSTNVTSNSVSLAWNASTDDNTGVASYDVYENNTKVAAIAGTTYIRTGLVPVTAYTYTVRAVDGAGNVSTSSTAVNITTPDIAFGISSYSVPVKTTTTATIATTLTKPGTVVVKHGKTTSTLTSTTQSMTLNTTHSLSLNGLMAKTTYYYQVIATDANGVVVTSPISSFKTATGGGRR